MNGGREECAERVEERREEQERIDETKRQRGESRVGSSPDPVDTTTTTNITVATSTSTTTRCRTRRATWSPNVYAPDTQRDLFVSFFRPSVPVFLCISLSLSLSLSLRLPIFFSPLAMRSRRSAILRGSLLPSPFDRSTSSQ